MKKAVLSSRIYLSVDSQLEKKIRDELTYTIPSHNGIDDPITMRTYSIIRDGLMSIPIGRLDLIPEDYEIVDKRILIPAEFPEFKFELRESQQLVYDNLNDNAIINAKPSWGKTLAGLAIAGKLAQKALVVVHTVPLRSQWANEVNKVYGIEPGIIGSGKFNIDSPIVIGNVQSLYNCVPLIQKEFGTVILDEMHHVSSPTFSRVIDKNLARFKIGLSGTLQRKDGKHAVFRDYFSNNVFTPPPENSMTPEVHVYRIGMHIPPGKGWALRINELMSDPAYVKTILNIADKYKGRKILAVADRVDFLQFCASRREKAVAVVGSTQNREELIKSVEYENDEIWGTISIFKEGISQNNLSTLILGAPINNDPMLEQLVGRIQRITPNKPTPIVVDICFDGFTGISQFNKRLEFYTRMGYNVKYI